METLLVVEQHRIEYHYNSRGKMNGNGGNGRFGSSPTSLFREINCRTFECGPGLLPGPLMGFESPGLNDGKKLERGKSDMLFTPKGKDLGGCSNGKTKIDEGKMVKKHVKSSPVSIKERFVGEDFLFSELWAGPAYSNSPPPSCLPIPKFSMRPKRTVSLELPVLESDLSLVPMAKSAPASPTRKFVGVDGGFGGGDGGDDDDFATKTLRRILNLDIADD